MAILGKAGPSIRLLAAFAVSLAALADPSSAQAATCDFLPKRPRPDWIERPTSSDSQVREVGSYTRSADDAADLMLDRSTRNARVNLAASLVTRVSSEETLTMRKEDGAASETYDLKARLASEVELAGTEVVDRWLDRESCTVYTLIGIDRTAGELAILDSSLGLLVQDAEDRSRSPEDRAALLSAASRLVESARSRDQDPSVLASFARYGVAEGRMRASAPLRADNEARLAGIRNSLDSGDDETARRGYRELLDLVARTRFSDQDDVAEPVLYFAAETELKRRDDCAAAARLDEIVKSSRFPYWVRRAEQRRGSVRCSGGPAVAGGGWREILGGRNSLVACASRTESRPRTWSKACSELSTGIRGVGGSSSQVALPPPSEFGNWLAGDGPRSPSADQPLVVLLADGTIETRPNPKNPGGTDFRFVGRIVSRIVRSDSTVFEDTYNGQSGWNPVSADMVLDVMAIGAAKRLMERSGQ